MEADRALKDSAVVYISLQAIYHEIWKYHGETDFEHYDGGSNAQLSLSFNDADKAPSRRPSCCERDSSLSITSATFTSCTIALSSQRRNRRRNNNFNVRSRRYWRGGKQQNDSEEA